MENDKKESKSSLWTRLAFTIEWKKKEVTYKTTKAILKPGLHAGN